MFSSFIKDDSPFACAFCGKQVSVLRHGHRNHCPYCLYGVHSSNMINSSILCMGLQQPINIEEDIEGYIITYKCTKCGKISRNKTTDDDSPREISHLLKTYGKK